MARTQVTLISLIFFLLTLAGSSRALSEIDDYNPQPTLFNGEEVPPMVQLNASYKQTISKGNWLVEAFSPYCPHCQSLAPKWQTLHEFYYTSNPAPQSNAPVHPKSASSSFTKSYDFMLAKLDCVAFGAACEELGVRSWPTMIFFRDGKEIKKLRGDRTMKDLGKFIEECLEIIKPGSRPTEALELPTAGAKNFKPRNAVLGLRKPTEPPPKRTPNVNGTSFPLNVANFENTVTESLEPWFVKFYAPWCPHCQDLAPKWAEMALEMKGKLNIGEVNCDVEVRLCKAIGIAGYPTLLYFRGPEQVEYEGLWGVGDLISYAKQAHITSSGVPSITAAEFEELEKTEDVIFLYFFDHATTSEDMLALDRLPLSLTGHGTIFKTDDAELVKRFSIANWPRLIVSRSGRSTAFNQLAPHDMRNVTKIRHWMRSVWLPVVAELHAANAREIMDGTFVVLGILSRSREEFAEAKREIKSAAFEWMDKEEQLFKLERQGLRDAKKLRIEEASDKNDDRLLMQAKRIKIDARDIKRKEVRFAWVDGVFWNTWTKATFGVNVVEDGEKAVIIDQENRRYWDTTSTGRPIAPSRTSILETLNKVCNSPSKLRSKPLGSSLLSFFLHCRNAILSHHWLAICGTIGGVVALLMLLQRVRRRRRSFGAGGYLRLDGKERLLGGSGAPNGKVD